LSYSRRQLIGAAASAALFAGTAKASSLAEIVAGLQDPPLPGANPAAPLPVAAAPIVSVPRGEPVIDPRLLARARAAFDRNRPLLQRTDVVAITDFSKPSREPRFFLLNTVSGRVTEHLVAHGRGSDPDHSGFVEYFSNAMGSYASSAGAYLSGDYYEGKYGRSLRLNGLEARNSNAGPRAIVVHSAWYSEPHVAAEYGKLGRSEGCFALSSNGLHEVLGRMGPGCFLYADKIA
jgi:hypothetical protein